MTVPRLDRRLALAGALLLPLLGGCAARMERATLDQAAHDLRCPAESVTVEKRAFGEYHAAGCGHEADYQVVGECYFEWTICRAAPLAERPRKP